MPLQRLRNLQVLRKQNKEHSLNKKGPVFIDENNLTPTYYKHYG